MQELSSQDTLPMQSRPKVQGIVESVNVEEERYRAKRLQENAQYIRVLLSWNILIESGFMTVSYYLPGVGNYRVDRFEAMTDNYYVVAHVHDISFDHHIELEIKWYDTFTCHFGRAYAEEVEAIRNKIS
jgi:hypothetical protein